MQHLDGGAMFGVVPKPLWERRIPADERNRIPLALRCLLVEHDAGLVLIVLGTGLLKPNISVIVGQLYEREDVRRDAGFSLFYMGINVGGFFGPLITGYLAQDAQFRGWLAGHGFDPNVAWHWGFGAAGVGMTLGLVQYIFGSKHLGSAGLHPAPNGSPARDARVKRRAVTLLGIGTAASVFSLANPAVASRRA